jgi:hypothetical protein
MGMAIAIMTGNEYNILIGFVTNLRLEMALTGVAVGTITGIALAWLLGHPAQEKKDRAIDE